MIPVLLSSPDPGPQSGHLLDGPGEKGRDELMPMASNCHAINPQAKTSE